MNRSHNNTDALYYGLALPVHDGLFSIAEGSAVTEQMVDQNQNNQYSIAAKVTTLVSGTAAATVQIDGVFRQAPLSHATVLFIMGYVGVASIWPGTGLAYTIVNIIEIVGIMVLLCYYMLSTFDPKSSEEEDESGGKVFD